MVSVKNINITEFNIISELNKDKKLLECKKYLSPQEIKNIEKYLPSHPKIYMSFELLDANTDLANSIRRCLIGEMEVLAFDFDEYVDLNSSDIFILSDVIKKQICLLRINQEISNYEKWKIYLHKENKTDEIIDVLSSDIVVMNNSKQIRDLMSNNIVLCRLRPGERIEINNIKICKGIAKTDAGKFSLLSNVTYKILDVNPLSHNESGSITGVSSLISNPTRFYIEFSTHRNIFQPKQVIVRCCDTLIQRLQYIYEEIKNISDDALSYYSSSIEIEHTNNVKHVKLIGEYWTLINVICRYCYILTDMNIKYVSPSLIHPEKEIGVINITHPEFSTLIQNSIKKIIEDLNSIKSSFL